MQSFLQKAGVFFVLICIVGASAGLVYVLFSRSNTQPQASDVKLPPGAAATRAATAKTCGAAQRNFQMGVVFPQWSTAAYGDSDSEWRTELPQMREQTAACWVEMPVLFYQASLTSTVITTQTSAPTIAAFTSGIQYAHALGLHVFVTVLLDSRGAQSWSGDIKFSTYAQEQAWFTSYWQALKPYAQAAAQGGVEQFALGTEEEWLQKNAPDTLWDGLIANIHSVYAGALTYDVNWSDVQSQPRAWMRNADLKMIGVSTYFPLISTPAYIDPQAISSLWVTEVKSKIDAFAAALGEPVFLSEIGYRNDAYALYNPWISTNLGPENPTEQAAACTAALASIASDPHILGSFFWGWNEVGAFKLSGSAAQAIHTYYTSLQAHA